MNIRQLQYLCGIVDQGLNLSKAALALHTSQPGISKQIRLLEEELGAQILVRQGNRIAGLTEHGRSILEIARRALLELDNLRQVGADASEPAGSLVVATTHVHARYILLPVVKRFKERFPKVKLSLRQGNPDQITHLVESGAANIGISIAPSNRPLTLAWLPCYRHHRSILVPRGHDLLRKKVVSLSDLAQYPLVSLDGSFAIGTDVINAFKRAGLEANVVVSATDSDVIKAYVAEGLGIATLPSIAFEAGRDTRLRLIDAKHLFESSIAYVSIHRHYFVRRFVLEFIMMLSPRLSPSIVMEALRSEEPLDESLAFDPTTRSD